MTRPAFRILRRVAIFVFFLWLSGFITIAGTELFWPKEHRLPAPADAIICLGADMSRMGWERAGPASTRRALTCAELYHEGLAPVILFTGYGHHVLSAAEAMADLATAEGVPEAAIILETEARSTIQNAAFSLPLLPPNTERVILVSDPFHFYRSKLIFRSIAPFETDVFAARDHYTSLDGSTTRNRFEWTLRESVVIWVNAGRLMVYIAAGVLGIDQNTRFAWFN